MTELERAVLWVWRTLRGIATILLWHITDKPIEDGEKRADVPELSRLQKLDGAAVLIATAGLGFFMPHTWWWAIPSAGVGLLWISDTGVHRILAERYDRVGWWHVLTISIITHLVNDLVFAFLAFGVGSVNAWLWGLN